MKITDRNLVQDPPLRPERGGQAGRGTTPTEGTPESAAGGDRVDVSEAARVLAGLRDDDPERAAKVERLRKAVEDGTYDPDVNEVARRFLREVVGPFVKR